MLIKCMFISKKRKKERRQQTKLELQERAIGGVPKEDFDSASLFLVTINFHSFSYSDSK